MKWTGRAHNGDWFDAANWSGGVPVSGQAANFTDGRRWAISLAGTQAAQAGAMLVAGDRLIFSGGTLNLAARVPKSGVATDLAISRNGSVTVARDAALTAQNFIQVGASASGTLTPGRLAVLGSLSGTFLSVEAGSVLVSGAAAHAVFNQGVVNVGGTLTVAAGAGLDGGPDTLSTFYSNLYVGTSYGAGVVSVTGTGSCITIGLVHVGNGNGGTLAVSNGGTLHGGFVEAGQDGDGAITVSGAGSALVTVNGERIGNAGRLPAASSLTIADHGSVASGTYGLDLQYGTLVLDATAQLSGGIVSEVGQITAVAVSAAHPGTVTLPDAIYLQSNTGTDGQYAYATNFTSTGGAVLRLEGAISGDGTAVLSAGAGTIVLGNASDNYSATSLYDARLEVAATGAAGAGRLSFIGGAAQAPVLQIDAGVDFGNTIAGFAGQDTIDLRGFVFGGAVTDTFAGGTLTLSNGGGSTSLSFSGTYAAASFAFADDHHGGTVIAFVHG